MDMCLNYVRNEVVDCAQDIKTSIYVVDADILLQYSSIKHFMVLGWPWGSIYHWPSPFYHIK